jgi:hypothetical protein
MAQGMLTIEARAAGRRRSIVPDWQIPIDDVAPPSGSPLTLRDLIERVVRGEVAQFRERQRDRMLVRFLSSDEIAEQAQRGRVDFGGHSIEEVEVEDDQAVGTALESFEDGLYLVLIDGRQYELLDEQVNVGPDSRVTFLRLAALAGG